jgi:hypothetical protein
VTDILTNDEISLLRSLEKKSRTITGNFTHKRYDRLETKGYIKRSSQSPSMQDMLYEITDAGKAALRAAGGAAGWNKNKNHLVCANPVCAWATSRQWPWTKGTGLHSWNNRRLERPDPPLVIEHALDGGYPSAVAESMLHALEGALRIFEKQRGLILDELERQPSE